MVALVAASAALGDVRVTRSELSGTRLRLEGTALPNRTITVDGAALGTSDGTGSFRIERDPFAKPADCTVDVGDGATTTTVTLSGCTVTAPAPPPPPPPAPASASLASLTVQPRDILAGETAAGTVTLTAAAPAGGFSVTLSSDNTAAATVPPSVTVPAGGTSAGFTVTTSNVTNSQSAIIIGTAQGVTAHDVVTVWTQFAYTHGSISIVPGGNGSGRVTSQPAGIDCTITQGNGAGACTSFFTVGTVVRLDARPAADSQFVGWRGLPGCADPSKITVARGTNINCQPGFSLR
jgi:hypothetical protein